MSSATPVPIAAPWQTGYQRYPVQFETFTGVNVTTTATAPIGQWWRPVWTRVVVTTNPIAGTRGLYLFIIPPDVGGELSIPTNATFPASTIVTASGFPGATAYNVSPISTHLDFIVAYPDMIWPPGTVFEWQVQNANANDHFDLTQSLLAVEIYTEDYGSLVQTPVVPTPLLA